MSIVIAPMSMAQMKMEAVELLKEHYQELTLNKDVVKLDVDWERYEHSEKVGCLFSLGAWEDGVLVGYSVFAVSRNGHYKGLKSASNDVLFLRKDKRKGITGIKLIKESEKRLRDMGVKKIVWHVKFGTVLGDILNRMGYVNEEYIVGKILGD